tara:strand:+ start:3860 stop:7855 length:3996 start_codon:yes stop_codon:yes gene_type:complete
MAKIKNTTAYPTVTPAANDLIIGTDVSDNKKTVTFTVSSIGGGAAVNQDLNSVLGVGNTSNLNIELNGSADAGGSSISANDIFPQTISAGGLGSHGAAGQVLSSTGTGLSWINAPGTNQSWNDTLAVSPVATANPNLTGTFTIATGGGLVIEGTSTLQAYGVATFLGEARLSDAVDLNISPVSRIGIDDGTGVYFYGSTGQFLRRTATGLEWSSATTLTNPTLQQVVTAGNTLLNSSIVFTGTGGVSLASTNAITGTGNITLTGNGDTGITSTQGIVTINSGVLNIAGLYSELQLQGNPGTTGQVLISQGVGATPIWGTAAGTNPTLQQVLDTGNSATQNIILTGNVKISQGSLLIDSTSFIELNADKGLLGQVLVSGGPSGPPTWAAAGTGTVTQVNVTDTTYVDMSVDNSTPATPSVSSELVTTGSVTTGPGGLTNVFYDDDTTGTNYTIANNLTTTATVGSGSGIIVNINSTSGGNVVLSNLSFVSGGSGYASGDKFRVNQTGSDNNLIIEVDTIASGTYYDQTGKFSSPPGNDWDIAVTNVGNRMIITNSDGTRSSSFTMEGSGGAVFSNAGSNTIELGFTGSGTGTVQSISLTDSTGTAGTPITSTGTFTFAEQAASGTYLRTTSAVTGTSIKLSTETPTIQVVATKGGTLLDTALTIQNSNGTTNNSFVLGTTASPSVATAGQVLAFNSASGGYMEWVNQAGGGNMTSWNINGDSGGAGTVSDGETVTIAGGAGISSVSTPATRTITLTNTGVLQVNSFGGNITLDGNANSTVGSKAALTLTITTAGTGYVANNYYPTTKATSSIGTASGIIVRVTSVNGTGGITGVQVFGGGKDWTIADTLTVDYGTSSATLAVASVASVGTVTTTTWRGLSGTDKTTAFGATVKTLGVFETELDMYSSNLVELSSATATGLRFGDFSTVFNDDQQIYAPANIGIASETNFANIRIGDRAPFEAGLQNNIAIGDSALFSTAATGATGDGNIGIGLRADQQNKTGSKNVTIGTNARNGAYPFASPATSTNANTSCVTIGEGAGDNSYGDFEIFIGSVAGGNCINQINNPNGSEAMHRIAIGAFAMNGENSDILNCHRYNLRSIAIGARANMFPGTSLSTNEGRGIYIGSDAGMGSNLPAFQSANRSDYHVVVGAEAMMDGAGGRQGQIAIGYQASIGDLATNIDTYNTSTNGIAIGYQAEGAPAVYKNITRSGVCNIAIGTLAGGTSGGVIQGGTIAIGSNAMAQGANSIAIGVNSDASSGAGVNNSIAIGVGAQATFANSVAIGPNASTAATNTIAFGSSTENLGVVTTSASTPSTHKWPVRINGVDYNILLTT